ncbi:MAG: T9SS type A sorting domain-containing protein [Bacteroidota bacterium]
MKAIHCLCFCLNLLIFTEKLNAQCECPPLPDPTGIIDTVSSVGELQSALQAANQNGGHYTILLEDGTYELANNLLYINQSMDHLTIRSLSGDREAVIIKGQGMGGNVGYIFNMAADHFTVADMTIGWVGNHAIQVHAEHDADFPLIQNVKFVNVREQMLKVSGSASSDFSDGGVVQCCEFVFPDGVAYQYYTGGIDAHRAKDWEVRFNTFRHIRSPDNSLAEHAIHFWSNSENTLVENNVIIDCDRGIGFGLGNSGHVGGTVRNNFVHTSRDVGIGLENASDVNIYHNTVVTDNYFNSIEYRFAGTVNAHIANNLTNEAVASRNGGTGTVEFNYLFLNDAIFVNANNYDYHLIAENPSITNAGTMLAHTGVDIDCHDRMDGLPDIGADEFNSVLNSINFNPIKNIIHVFPNPNAGRFFIESTENVAIEIVDLNGKTIYKKRKLNGSLIELEEIKSGIYFLKYMKGDLLGVEKIFVSYEL